jgi:hypothetical protein
MLLLTENALPSGSVATVPWTALNEWPEEFDDPACIPVNLKAWNPVEMDLSDMYWLYKHIISLQESSNGKQFKFFIDNKILASLGPISTNNPLLPTSPPAQSPSVSPAPSKPKLEQKQKFEDNIAIVDKVSKRGKTR